MKHVLATAALLLATARVSRASTLTFTASGIENGSFQLSSNPTPTSTNTASTNGDTDFVVPNTLPGASIIYFYNAASGGGFGDDVDGLGFYGPQVYTGTEAAPVFAPGTFLLSSVQGGPSDETLVISAAAAATPEPSSFALLFTGLAGAAGVARRKGWLPQSAA